MLIPAPLMNIIMIALTPYRIEFTHIYFHFHTDRQADRQMDPKHVRHEWVAFSMINNNGSSNDDPVY